MPAATNRNVLENVGYFGEHPSPEDLAIFMNEYRTDGADTTLAVVEINGGGKDPNNTGFGADLNMQYPEAMVYPIYYSVGEEEATRSPAGSFTCPKKTASRSRSSRRPVTTSRTPRRTMQRACASCSRSSTRVVSASFS